jgi:hypothetical protein
LRYLVQQYVPASNSYRILHWAKSASELTKRVPEIETALSKGLLAEKPAKAAPATVAKRAEECRDLPRYSEYRCDYERVVEQDGRLRVVVSPKIDCYLWQAAVTYRSIKKVKPNTWQTIFRSPTASGLASYIGEAGILWFSLLGADPHSSNIGRAILNLPEYPREYRIKVE